MTGSGCGYLENGHAIVDRLGMMYVESAGLVLYDLDFHISGLDHV